MNLIALMSTRQTLYETSLIVWVFGSGGFVPLSAVGLRRGSGLSLVLGVSSGHFVVAMDPPEPFTTLTQQKGGIVEPTSS